MLRKLMKHELRATARSFVPVYIVFAAVTALLLCFVNGAPKADFAVPYAETVNALFSFMMGVAMVAYVVLFIAILLMTVIICVQRFYRNLLTDEGYLSFTLPVTPAQHIWSKLLVSAFWVVCSVALLFLSGGILLGGFRLQMYFLNWPVFWSDFWETFAAYPQAGIMLTNLVLLLVFLLASLVHMIMQLYACTALGNFAPQHRVLLGIGAFFAASVVENFIAWMFSMSNLLHWFFGLHLTDALYASAQLLGLAIVFEVAFTVLYFFATNYVLKRKLNLE